MGLLKLLITLPAPVLAAVISAVVSLLTLALAATFRYQMEKHSLNYRLKTEYAYEQRKRLRNLTGRYRGATLEAAEAFNHRMFNLYRNEQEGWLEVKGKYDSSAYYFTTTVYRFLAICSLA